MATGRDSPVSEDSSTSSPSPRSSRQSAGTTSWERSTTTSPATRSPAATRRSAPPRRTRAPIAERANSSSRALSVLTRWTAPTSADAPVMPATSPASVRDPTAADRAAPAASTGVSGLASSSMNAAGRPMRAGCPEAASRPALRPASSRLRPSSVLPSRSSARSAGIRCQGVVSTGGVTGRDSSCRARQVPRQNAAVPAPVPAAAPRAVARAGGAWRAATAPTPLPPAARNRLSRSTWEATPTASTTRPADSRSVPIRMCAPQAGGSPSRCTPIPQSAAASARRSPDSSSTTAPSACSPRREAVRRSPPGTTASAKPNAGSGRALARTTRAPARRAAAATASAPGAFCRARPATASSRPPLARPRTLSLPCLRSRAAARAPLRPVSSSSSSGPRTQPSSSRWVSPILSGTKSAKSRSAASRGSAPSSGTRSASSWWLPLSASSSSTTVSVCPRRRSTLRSMTVAPRSARARPRVVAKPSRPASGALGTPESATASPRRGPANGAVAAPAAAVSAIERST